MVYSDLSALVRKFLYLIISVLALSCREKVVLFQEIKPGHSNIHFNNKIVETDSINQLDIENVYNGGGAGIGDFNNDGLPDIFLTGNLVECKLYLNRGDFIFQDVTSDAKVGGEGRWARGVAVVDINNDGLQDIYVSATLKKKPEERINLLYVNQGLNGNKIPVFSDQAAEYGLDDDSHSTQAVFFDYDNDEDLDLYIVVNEINERYSPYMFRPVMKNGSHSSAGKLYRNDWSDSLKHPFFTDVSKPSGIQTEGYGHSASITDFNNDGWKDIYVSNDFLTNDLLWINNHDGTFTDQISVYFKHTSANSMGNDIGDINNDGLQDVITLDMNPEDNYRKKMMMPPNSYQMYQNTERYGYSYQYVRNTLQLNQGHRIENDSVGLPVYSEIGYYAGITETDWSWSPVLTDFNNDGFRDLVVCNGFPRDITDHDFAMFRNKAYLVASKNQILMQVPEVRLHNYVFRNNGDLTFSDVSHSWGMTASTFSNGAAYADLDIDGDMDLIINNINDEASLYRNNTRELDKGNTHFLRVKLNGKDQNKKGFGSLIEIWYDKGKKQIWENNPYRGYLSTIEDIAHFGLGNIGKVDSLRVIWPDGKTNMLKNIEADQIIGCDYSDAGDSIRSPEVSPDRRLFSEITRKTAIDFTHQETDFVDFNIQKLIPHKLSEYGPALAAGDIDGNGLDDIVTGGSATNSACLFLQQYDGKFKMKLLLSSEKPSGKSWDDTGILLFDADGDEDPDLYIASGGFENESNSPAYRDHFYENDGKGNFSEIIDAIPPSFISKFCVRGADFDKDGDLDLFVAGRVDPWKWPKPVSSIILRNDSKPGHIMFTDITKEAAGDLVDIGLVCDALFTDFDNDGWTDLVLAGEWMPVTMLKNENGRFRNVTSSTGIADQVGWWNSIAPGDFDNDGDIDYIIGNLGLNSFYKASPDYPVSVYARDFDNNGSYDAFPSAYLKTSQEDSTLRDFPVHTRDDAVKQMISLRTKFQNYKSFAVSTVDQLFSEEQLKNSLVLKANNLKSSYCRNDGNNKFTLIQLPPQAQISALNGMVADDFDGDGNLDVVINGNDWGTEVSVGRYDALNGLILKGDGNGNFSAQSIIQSGIYIPGNGKALAAIRGETGNYLLAAAQNRGKLKVFELNKKIGFISLKSGDVSAELTCTNGKTRKLEFYYGSSFLSQSSRFIKTDENIKSLLIYGNNGEKRTIETDKNLTPSNKNNQ
jgi:hypothetical protein